MMNIKIGNTVYENLVTYDELTDEEKKAVHEYKGETNIYNNSQLLEFYDNKYGYTYSMNELLFVKGSLRFLGFALNPYTSEVTMICKDMTVKCEVEYL